MRTSLLALGAAMTAFIPAQLTSVQAQDAANWMDAGKAAVEQRLNTPKFPDHAKNVIIFIGDGMGVSTITAGRIFDGQSRGESGEENVLSFEKFPHVALSKTYNTDAQVPDSAGTATAIMTGSKTRIGVLGIAPQHPHGLCTGSRDLKLTTLIEIAEDTGLATGVVTTTRLTHATPASTYAHSPNRDWEDDTELTDEAREAGCSDIAQQLIAFNHGDGIDVAMGGGRRHFLPTTKADPENPKATGRRKDNRDLIADWKSKYPNGRFIWNKQQFDAVSPDKTSRLLGLFSESHMAYEADRAQDLGGEPSLAEMTEKAIDVLAAKDKGYVLLVEGGRIDHAHHGGNAFLALKDTQAFSQAVAKAVEKVNLDETLIIVTADHSHVFTIAGYPSRGNPILGLVHSPSNESNNNDGPTLASDGKPYTTLGYQNGPGAINAERADLSNVDTTTPDYRQQALIPTGSETHGGEDVAIFATGAGSALISGVMEENVIFHVMQHALRDHIN